MAVRPQKEDVRTHCKLEDNKICSPINKNAQENLF